VARNGVISACESAAPAAQWQRGLEVFGEMEEADVVSCWVVSF